MYAYLWRVGIYCPYRIIEGVYTAPVIAEFILQKKNNKALKSLSK